MPKFFEVSNRALGRVISVVSAMACVLCALMALHITAEVICRAFFDRPLPGTVAIVSHYYMIAVTFLPLALVERRDANVSVEVVTQHLPAALQDAVRLFGWVLAAGVFALLAWTSWSDALRHQKVGTYVMESGREIILWPSYYMLPLGYGLVTLFLVAKALSWLTGDRSGGPADAQIHPTSAVD